MKTVKRAMFPIAACSGSKSPGPLEGTWRLSGIMPMTITFRDGETESLGIIEQVSYEVDGQDVLVTYLNGLAEGMTVRYTITGPNSVHSEMGTLQRIR